ARRVEGRWWSPKSLPVFGPGGEVAYIIHAIEDVTEQRALALASSLFDQASDGIFIADLDGRFIEGNAAACEMLGYSRDELVDKTVADTIMSKDALRLAMTREQLLAPGAVHLAEWMLQKKDGTPIPVEVSSKILPDGRWVAFVRDIRERKR